MLIALGCDHRGLKLKQTIMKLLAELGHDYRDFGCYDGSSVDYPDIACKVTEAIATGKSDQGILICGTGIGMSIAANKENGLRAALCCNVLSAQRARQHNDANILCLGEEILNQDLALDIVKAYLAATFEGGRHLRRVEKIREIESNLLDNG